MNGEVCSSDEGSSIFLFSSLVTFRFLSRSIRSTHTCPHVIHCRVSNTQQNLNGPSSERLAPNHDPFATGSNAYVSLSFQVNNYSMGGCTVDTASVASSGGSKVKLHIANEFTAGEYVIWNSLGKSRRVVPPNQPLALLE